MISTVTMNAYVGTANARPASRMPRRFIAVSTTITTTATSTGCLPANPQAAPRFATPDDTDTATVST